MKDVYAAGQAALEPEREANDRLAHVNGMAELQAALLAMLLPRDSRRADRAWKLETKATPHAGTLRAHVASLSGAARLPWFDVLLARMALQPLAARQALLLATRRVMGARGQARPIDRLHWLAMRRGLGEVGPLAARPDAGGDAMHWLESDVLAIAVYTAFLARMVPGAISDSALGAGWYDAVMSGWQQHAEVPAFTVPGADAMVEALGRLQTLSWMQRPIVVRGWLTSALVQSRGRRLEDLSADALRLSCGLLDSPMPPELARHYIQVAPDGAR